MSDCIINKTYSYAAYKRLRAKNRRRLKVRGWEKIFHTNKNDQRRHTDGQQVHKKMINIVNHQKNANQNHDELSADTGHTGYHKKDQR